MNRKFVQNQSIVKSELRKQFLAKRQTLKKSYVEQSSRIIVEKLFAEIKKLAPTNVLVYLAFNNEVDTTEIINRLIASGKRVFLPKYDPANTPGVKPERYPENTPGVENAFEYVFAEFTNWQNLEEGPYGILQPSLSSRHPELARPERSRRVSGSIDVAIIPGVAFDKKGTRLGYGKGVFDRLLAKSKDFRIGLAYEFQIVDTLPKENHDLVMDMVVTENRLIVNRKW